MHCKSLTEVSHRRAKNSLVLKDMEPGIARHSALRRKRGYELGELDKIT
jgi:hypothetical protein